MRAEQGMKENTPIRVAVVTSHMQDDIILWQQVTNAKYVLKVHIPNQSTIAWNYEHAYVANRQSKDN